MQKIEFTIVGISHAETEGGYIVLLESEEVLKKIPVHMGINEGQEIAMALEAFEMPRPSTHNLLVNMLRDMKAKLTEVIISRVFEGVFFAKLIIDRSNSSEDPIEIDARTSDAIILAVLVNCPIYIASEVVESVGISVEKEPDFSDYKEDDQAEFYGMSIEDLEKELKKSVIREEYEAASRIRDRINFLKNKKK